MQNYKIAAVVVTYNRKQLLLQCLTAILKQTIKPHIVFIVDNASTDGTQEYIAQNGFKDSIVDSIYFKYTNLGNNQGGAGGFFNGMKMAAESEEHFDAVWVMDDDGIPEHDCLNNLSKYLKSYHFICPLVLSIEDPEKLAFSYKGRIYSKKEFMQETTSPVVYDYGCPMNGILFSMNLIDTIGYPIPELFIWGDENNYQIRAKHAKYEIVTIKNAIHYHPKDRMVMAKSIFGTNVIICPSYWKGYCFVRNYVYNTRLKYNILKSLIIISKFYLVYVYYYLLKKLDIKWFLVFNNAFFSGFKKKPDTGYFKYMQ